MVKTYYNTGSRAGGYFKLMKDVLGPKNGYA